MAVQTKFQYVRLRNLALNTSTLEESEVQPGLEADDDDSIVLKTRRLNHKRWQNSLKKFIIPVSLLLNIITVWKLLFSSTTGEQILTYCKLSSEANHHPRSDNFIDFNLTAPALVAVESERVVFSSAFGIERSPFQGAPDKDNNKLWGGLYDCRLQNLFSSII